jgi:ribosomal-protein-alanine N-acetyltransferase
VLEEFRPGRIPKSIESSRLILKQLQVSDADEYDACLRNSFSGHLEPWWPRAPEEGTSGERRRAMRDQIFAALDKWESDQDYRLAIRLKADGTIIGQLGLTQVVRGVSQCSAMGYWIAKDHLRRGYATEAVVLGFQFGFECLALHRITLWIAPDNIASVGVARKLGLRFEGLAERALFLAGAWRDTDIYAITSEEWSERKSELIHLVESKQSSETF